MKKRWRNFCVVMAYGIIGLGTVLSTEYNKTFGIILLIVGFTACIILRFIPEK
ncbi:hypothetical protein ACFDTO_21340 [Microbacteriaceae bacterium 4G12]